MPSNPASTPKSLDTAKREAKRLRRALHERDSAAVARFSAVFGDRKQPDRANHADCLHVIAREAGAESWPRLKLAVETERLNRMDRIAALERAVMNGNAHMIDRLLDLDPDLPDAHFGLQLAFARKDAALAALQKDPSLATEPIGRRWPIHHLAFSRLHERDPSAGTASVALLNALVDAGADVNQGFPAEPGSDHELSPLYGALGHARNIPLAEALLGHGANPNDNESLYHATELPTLDGLRLLFVHGAEVGRTNAFHRMLDRESIEGVRLFLDNGADPNTPVYRHPSDELAEDRNALHHAILRGRSGEIGALLIDHGVDVNARYEGRLPYAHAVICGNRSMADMLRQRGHAGELDPVDRFLGCIVAGDRSGAESVLAAHPGIMTRLSEADLARQTLLAMDAGALPALRLMADLGFDLDHKGESDMPPVHSAAWWGHADTVAMYLERGVDLETHNMYGAGALGTAVHGSAECPGRADGDYLRCVELLVEAGARILPDQGHLEMGSEAVTLFLEAKLEDGTG